jgi:hypothetical protein
VCGKTLKDVNDHDAFATHGVVKVNYHLQSMHHREYIRLSCTAKQASKSIKYRSGKKTPSHPSQAVVVEHAVVPKSDFTLFDCPPYGNGTMDRFSIAFEFISQHQDAKP